LWRSFVLGLLASLAVFPHDVPASTVAYTGEFLPGGFDFDRLTSFSDPPETVGRLDLFPAAGAFAGDDFAHEYMVDYTLGRLFSVDVLSGQATLIGSVSTPDNAVMGMHWDPTTDQMFLIATDASCATSTLYTVDVSDASTTEVGSTQGCLVGLAIDADGHAFGIDQTSQSLVSIDTATGAAMAIGPLGIQVHSLLSGFDFDPSSGLLYLFAIDYDSSTRGIYLVDTALGEVTLTATYSRAYLGLAFAEVFDFIMSNGFDP
jgi:hypothetical protein